MRARSYDFRSSDPGAADPIVLTISKSFFYTCVRDGLVFGSLIRCNHKLLVRQGLEKRGSRFPVIPLRYQVRFR